MVGIETDLLVVVADTPDGVANRPLDIELRVSRDLADDHAQAFGDGGLAGHPSVGVLRQHAVEDRIRHLVTDLVGVAFGDGLRGEEKGW